MSFSTISPKQLIYLFVSALFVLAVSGCSEDELGFADDSKDPRALFKVINSNTGKVVENLLVKYDGDEYAIDSTFILYRPFGNIKLEMVKSDSSFVNFESVAFDVSFEKNGQVFTSKKPYEFIRPVANLTVDITDQNGNKVTGATLKSNNKTATSDSNGRATINNVVQLETMADKPWITIEKSLSYDIEKDGYADFSSQTVKVNEGDNSFSSKINKISSNLSELHVAAKLHGQDLFDLKATLVNKNDPNIVYELTSSGEFVHFPELIAGDYTLTVSDNQFDDRFDNTEIEQTIHEGENKAIVDVLPLKNAVELTVTIYDSETLESLDGQTVSIVKSDGDPNTLNHESSYFDNEIVDVQTTISGKAVFQDLTPGTEYHLITTGPNRYRKVNGYFKLEDVDRRSQKKVALNMVSVEMIDNISASDIMIELTQVFNISFVLGDLRIYGSNAQYKEHILRTTQLIGMPNAVKFVYNPGLSSYDQSYYSNPYPINRQFKPMTTNISGEGTNTTTNKVALFNGNIIITHATIFEAGSEQSTWDHEFLNLICNSTTHNEWASPLSTDDKVQLGQSNKTLKISTLQIRTAVLHYDTLDSNNRIIEYALPVRYEE